MFSDMKEFQILKAFRIPAAFIGDFSSNLGISFVLHAELVGIMIAIEITFARGWRKLWIEDDSMLPIQAFKLDKVIHRRLRNRWKIFFRNRYDLSCNKIK
ncbi:hypothetical protein AAZX31_11G170400 [Glycine max]